jgi:cytosine/adenosine deaminase-related metal-dependent hydrolase
MRTLIRNGYLLTLDDADRVFEQGDLLIQDGVIQAIGERLDGGEDQAERVIDASGKLVMPGLVNADVHAAELLRRGLFENQPGDEAAEVHFESTLTPEAITACALLAGVEMMRSGVTAILDHWQFSAAGCSAGVEAVLRAYTQTGLRVTLAVGMGGDGCTPEGARQAYEDIFERWHAESWHTGENGRIRLALAPTRVLWQDAGFAGWLSKFAARQDADLHFHFNQRAGEAGAIRAAHARGLLNRSSSVAHAVWLSPDEIELLAGSQAVVVHTPPADLYQGRGLPPLHRLLEAGVPLALGSGQGSGGNLRMFDIMKMAASFHRIYQPDYHRWPTVEQVLAMAAGGGASQLAVSRKADLALLNLKSISFAPLNVLKSQLVCLEDGSAVDTLLVDGRVVMEAGRILTVDQAAIQQTMRAVRL